MVLYAGKDIVSSEEELRSILGSPSELVKNKVIHFLDDHCRDFISKSPLLLLSTSDRSGACDVSPRGDAPGFVHILDEKHLVIPERPGNRRVDSLRNILSNPNAGLFFIIPGLEETLRINGHAIIFRDQDILKNMEANGKIPLLGICVTVQECFAHCAKAFKRSQLWNPASWTDKADLPNIARMLADHAKLPGMNTEKVKELLEESYTKRLY